MTIGVLLMVVAGASDGQPVAKNLLVDAKISGNLEGYDEGSRGAADHVIYDVAKGTFMRNSQWHEYGIGFGADLGVVTEADPAWWMAEWDEPVEVNGIVLSGAYPNQPQPDTAWKIETRANGEWDELERGIGGWYDDGLFEWGGAEQGPIEIDAFRVSLFSKDDTSPLKSIHFRGEENVSWIVGFVPPIDARIVLPGGRITAGQGVTLKAEPVLGDMTWWDWEIQQGAGSDERGEGPTLAHVFNEVGHAVVRLRFGTDEHESVVTDTVRVRSPIEASIQPLDGPVMVGNAVRLRGEARLGRAKTWRWDFGDGTSSGSRTTQRVFKEPGTHRVTLTVSDGKFEDRCMAIVRAHDESTLGIPQVHLDTDQKNEQDDQHYLGYGVFSELDILGVNSIHHGGGQEQVNYDEIIHVLELSRQSGLPDSRQPDVYRGADERLVVPASKVWSDTEYEPTEASEAILAAARGASPANPVWVVPVGPGTNTAAAILQARDEGLDLQDRMRVMWLGGSSDAITHEFNGNNDPWSMHIVASSGIETWIMPAPVGARVAIDKRTQADWYADHALGQYLLRIVPARNKPLFDPSCLSAIISEHLGLDWVKEFEHVTVGGPDEDYRWSATDEATNVKVIREIDQEAMKRDIFDTMKGKASHLTTGD